MTVVQEKRTYKWNIYWHLVLGFAYVHIAGIYGLLLILTGQAKVYTAIFGYLYGMIGGLGVTAGAHRLWSHRTFKATWQCRLLLTLLESIAFQDHIHKWVQDHRSHHKFMDTDGDPYNASRGFFFSHIGWLMMKKHPDVPKKGKTVDLSDVEADPIVMWQKKYAGIILPFFCFVIPTIIPVYLWNENPWTSWYSRMWFLALSLNSTFLVNSAAHMWGIRPYDKRISPTENKIVGIMAYGEGWHNYHHTFPWDYKAAELGNFEINLSAAFIDLMAKIGWAYDLRTAPVEMIKKRAERTGDGTLKDPHDNKHHLNSVWGWDDRDMGLKDKMEAIIYYPGKIR